MSRPLATLLARRAEHGDYDSHLPACACKGRCVHVRVRVLLRVLIHGHTHAHTRAHAHAHAHAHAYEDYGGPYVYVGYGCGINVAVGMLPNPKKMFDTPLWAAMPVSQPWTFGDDSTTAAATCTVCGGDRDSHRTVSLATKQKLCATSETTPAKHPTTSSEVAHNILRGCTQHPQRLHTTSSEVAHNILRVCTQHPHLLHTTGEQFLHT
jgi:hypothetical protein